MPDDNEKTVAPRNLFDVFEFLISLVDKPDSIIVMGMKPWKTFEKVLGSYLEFSESLHF